MGATTLDKAAFDISYHMHTPISDVYKMPVKKRMLFQEFLKEQKTFENQELNKSRKK